MDIINIIEDMGNKKQQQYSKKHGLLIHEGDLIQNYDYLSNKSKYTIEERGIFQENQEETKLNDNNQSIIPKQEIKDN